MAYQLPKLSDEDFEVTYVMKPSFSSSSSSTGSSGASSPSSSSTSCSTTSSNSAHSKKYVLAATAPEDNFLLKKRTVPPTKITENKAPRIPYEPRPLRHIHKRPLSDPENNENMRKYREFRQLEKQKAQESKLNGGIEEPPKKKRAQKRKFNN